MLKEKNSNSPYSTEINKLSELKNFIGKELGLSEWVEITQEQINTFAKITDDNQWIHVNSELCKNTLLIKNL
ncbi:MaoC/PaaZ C-terminal domain-containing protein [Flavobacteriaceae bacterium]|nr:MaoC/PaaZ C-terminal domain-containing protein [Flavobacteriaceae bacterium]